MKRWIYLFLSLAVSVSVLSLGVHAEEEIENSLLDLYVYSSIVSSTTPDFATEIPQQGAIIARSITNNTNQRYSKIKNFSFTCPANSYFLIDFDVVAYDSNHLANNQNPACYASRNLTQFVPTDFSISGSNGSPTIYRAEVTNNFWSHNGFQFVHFSIFGVNDNLDANNIVITYTNPIVITGNLINGTNLSFNQRIENVNCKTSVSLDQISNLVEEISQILSNTYSEIVSIGDTLGNFYNDFHSKWSTLVDTYIYNLYNLYGRINYGCYELLWNANGIGSRTRRSYGYSSAVITGLNSITNYLFQHMKLENEAINRGSNDTYESLADSADFGSLSDFAGAGSAASWSSGSFSNGLSGIWDFFSNDTFYDLDTTDNRLDTHVYHEEFYQNNLGGYFEIVGSEYDGSTSYSGN